MLIERKILMNKKALASTVSASLSVWVSYLWGNKLVGLQHTQKPTQIALTILSLIESNRMGLKQCVKRPVSFPKNLRTGAYLS